MKLIPMTGSLAAEHRAAFCSTLTSALGLPFLLEAGRLTSLGLAAVIALLSAGKAYTQDTQLVPNGSFEAQSLGTTVTGGSGLNNTTAFSHWRVGVFTGTTNFTATIIANASEGDRAMKLAVNNGGVSQSGYQIDLLANSRLSVAFGTSYDLSFDAAFISSTDSSPNNNRVRLVATLVEYAGATMVPGSQVNTVFYVASRNYRTFWVSGWTPTSTATTNVQIIFRPIATNTNEVSLDNVRFGPPVPDPFVDLIKADMQLNEAPLLNAPSNSGWTKGAIITMGGAARGDATPSWWAPDNPAYKSSAPWNAIVPWFVLWPGAAHAATNVRVKVGGLGLYLLSKANNTWTRIDVGAGNPTWAGVYDFGLTTTSELGSSVPRVEPDGKLSYKLDGSYHPIHGGLGKYAIDGSAFAAVFVRLKTELILDNPSGPDDRASAQILIQCGADYYPTMTTRVADFAPMTYNPGVGYSRFGLVETWPRTHYFATIDPPGNGDNLSSVYAQNGGVLAMPIVQFAANPPPEDEETLPAIPQGVTATPGDTQVTLNWARASAATSYNVKHAANSSGPYTTVANVLTNSYTDTGLANGTTYYYVVSAVNAGGESANTAATSATPTPAPTPSPAPIPTTTPPPKPSGGGGGGAPSPLFLAVLSLLVFARRALTG